MRRGRHGQGAGWSSARGEIQIETFREKMAGATLQELFDEMRKRPSNRRVETNWIQANSFSLSGMQGLKKFHVRGYSRRRGARGITILFDQAMETIMLPMVEHHHKFVSAVRRPSECIDFAPGVYDSGIVVSEDGCV